MLPVVAVVVLIQEELDEWVDLVVEEVDHLIIKAVLEINTHQHHLCTQDLGQDKEILVVLVQLTAQLVMVVAGVVPVLLVLV